MKLKINYPRQLHKQNRYRLFFLIVLGLSSCQPSPKVEYGKCLVKPSISNRSCFCTWEKKVYENRIVKVKVTQDSFSSVIYQKDSLVTKLSKEGEEELRYSTTIGEQIDSVFTKVLIKNNRRVFFYEEHFTLINGTWERLLAQEKKSGFSSLGVNAIEFINRYSGNKLVDSVYTINKDDYELIKKYKLVVDKLQFYAQDSILLDGEGDIILRKDQSFYFFDSKDNFGANNGMWTDSVNGSIEYYSEGIKKDRTYCLVAVEYFPTISNSYWNIDSMKSIYQPIVEKIKKQYLVDARRLDYTVIMNTDRVICYESYRKNYKNFILRDKVSGIGMNCDTGETFVRVNVSYIDKKIKFK
jgi:hypothetical protein